VTQEVLPGGYWFRRIMFDEVLPVRPGLGGLHPPAHPAGLPETAVDPGYTEDADEEDLAEMPRTARGPNTSRRQKQT
jgi:hypothetical protein